MPTIIDLGQKVKAKYPGQYDDLTDDEVGRRVQDKFPGAYTDFSRVTPQLKTTVAQAQNEASKSVARRFITELPKEAAKTAVGLPIKTVLSVSELPETAYRGANILANTGRFSTAAPQRTYNVPVLGHMKSIQSEAENAAGNIIEGKQGLSAMAKPISEAILGPIETATLATQIYKGGKSAINLAKTTFAQRREAKAIADSLSVIKPKLTPAQEDIAYAAGRGKKVGLSRTIVVEPTKRDLEVADAVKGVVKKGKDEFKNIGALRGEIEKTSNAVRAGLKKNDAIFNEATLRSWMKGAKEESRVTFGTDKTLEGAYDSVIDEFAGLVRKKPKNISNLYDTRIEFDQLMKKKFGADILNPAKAGDKVRSNAILDVRRAANDFIAEMLPEGNAYKEMLKKENLMFEAIKNIAQKAPKVGSTGIQRFMQTHSLIRRGAYVGGGAAAGATLGAGGASFIGGGK